MKRKKEVKVLSRKVAEKIQNVSKKIKDAKNFPKKKN